MSFFSIDTFEALLIWNIAQQKHPDDKYEIEAVSLLVRHFISVFSKINSSRYTISGYTMLNLFWFAGCLVD